MEPVSHESIADALNQLVHHVDSQIQQCSAVFSSTSTAGEEYVELLVEILQALRGRICGLQSRQSKLDPKSLQAFIKLTKDFFSVFASFIERCKHEILEVSSSGGRPPEQSELKQVASSADELFAQKVWEIHAGPQPRMRPAEAPPLLYLEKLEDLTNSLFPPVTLGPWINTEELRIWLDHCDREHPDHCQSKPQDQRMFAMHPRWLIDVHRLCLVEAKGTERYLALSYVWGTVKSFKTLTSNLSSLQREGSLSRGEFPPSMQDQAETQSPAPKTIFDAIVLTKLIAERFIWIDSLCIVQDDEQDKRAHLSNMGSIYGNAYATIVAAGGSAFNGLRGIEQVTPPLERELTPAWYAQKANTLARKIHEHHRRIQASWWSQRAWTFQEQIFSRRLLIFEEAGVSWECHCAVWFEGLEILDGQCKNHRPAIAPGLSMSSSPNLQNFVRHLSAYTKRALTYPEDVLDAFDGVLGALSTVYQGKFVCGIPEMFFDATLLWYNESALRRRRARRSEGAIMPGSWSWAAWEGAVTLGDPTISPENVEALIQWKYKSANDSHWSAIPIFAHKDDTTSAAPATDKAISHRMSLSHVLLACPERSFFSFLELISPVQVLLKGESGECVGMLSTCESLSATEEQNSPYELVAISKQSFKDQIAYNVLWIGWEGDVAHRRGIGRIMKSDWESSKPERIDLVLG